MTDEYHSQVPYQQMIAISGKLPITEKCIGSLPVYIRVNLTTSSLALVSLGRPFVHSLAPSANTTGRSFATRDAEKEGRGKKLGPTEKSGKNGGDR